MCVREREEIHDYVADYVAYNLSAEEQELTKKRQLLSDCSEFESYIYYFFICLGFGSHMCGPLLGPNPLAGVLKKMRRSKS